MATLSTRTNIRIHCEKGNRTLVLDAEDVREIINTLIRQNMIEFYIESMPDYRKDTHDGPYSGVPYESMMCHAAYAMAETSDCGAEVISVCIDLADGFVEASRHAPHTLRTEQVDLISSPAMQGVPTPTSLPQWAMQHPDVLNNMRSEEGSANAGE